MRVSEICVKRIPVNQGLGVYGTLFSKPHFIILAASGTEKSVGI